MQHAHFLRASQRHTSHRASVDCAAPTHSDIAFTSALAQQTKCAGAYSNQRVSVTSIRDRCLGTHVCFTPRRSRTIVFRLSGMITVHIAGHRRDCQTPSHTSPTAHVESSSPVVAHDTPCPHVHRSVSATNVEPFLRRRAYLGKKTQYSKKGLQRLIFH